MTWLPSENVTIALIGTIGAILAAMLGAAVPKWFERRKSKPRKISQPVPVEVRPLAPSAPASKAVALSAHNRPALRPAVTAITIMDIVENIQRVPPFQQDDIHKHYVGMRVKWSATLRGVDRFKDESLHVTVKFTERDTLGFCRAGSSDVHGLVHAPEGTLVEVEGAIEWITKYEASMVDCVINPSPLNEGP